MAARKSKALTNWDEQLAAQAQAAAGMEESVASGQFFSLQGGVLSFNDSPMPDNQAAVIIVDHVLENVYYEGGYDPDVPQSPTCFAFGRDDSELSPHSVVVEADQAQSDLCKDCEMNEWGTADVGKGKACRNVRRLALIPAGSFDNNDDFEQEEDIEHFQSSQIAYMKLPVTSVKAWAAFVKQVASALKRPPHGIFARIKVVPDPKSQFKVTFEALGKVPDDIMGVIMERHEEAQGLIEFPYQLGDDEPEPKKPARGKKAPAKKPARDRKKY